MNPIISDGLTFDVACYISADNILDEIECDRILGNEVLGFIPTSFIPYIKFFTIYLIVIIIFDWILRKKLKGKYYGWRRVVFVLFLVFGLIVSTSLLFGFPHVFQINPRAYLGI